MSRDGRRHDTRPPKAGKEQHFSASVQGDGSDREGIGGAGSGPERSEASTAPRPASAAAYLETNRNIVDGPAAGVWPIYGASSEEHYWECRAVNCRSWVCPHCAIHLALKLRERLVPVLEKFSALLMLTLTVDQELFGTPAQAYWYVKDRRALSELVRALAKRKYLVSRRYFCVLEWHKKGWAHFHVLVEAKRIPFVALCQLWGRNRPVDAPAWNGTYANGVEGLKGCSPEFGSVRISGGKRSERFGSATHAANYVLKYMLKQPEVGYPRWVIEELNAGRQIRRYDKSKGLWPSDRKSKVADDRPEAPTVVDNERLDGISDDDGKENESDSDISELDARLPRERRTVEERLANCGKPAALLRVTEHRDPNGLVLSSRRSFWRKLAIPFAEALQLLDSADCGRRHVRLRAGDLIRLAGPHDDSDSGVAGDSDNAVGRDISFDDWNAAIESRGRDAA